MTSPALRLPPDGAERRRAAFLAAVARVIARAVICELDAARDTTVIGEPILPPPLVRLSDGEAGP